MADDAEVERVAPQEHDPQDLVHAIRLQNWKNGGALVIDADEAVRLVYEVIDASERRGRESAQTRVVELEKALKPFADISLLQDSNYCDGLPDAIDGPDLSITPADVRRARAALSALPSSSVETAREKVIELAKKLRAGAHNLALANGIRGIADALNHDRAGKRRQCQEAFDVTVSALCAAVDALTPGEKVGSHAFTDRGSERNTKL